jgi:hypothetical protein
MMYRTPIQDERLQHLYAEREQILDAAAELYLRPEELALALGDVDAEIELLTTDLDDETDLRESVALAFMLPPEPVLTPPSLSDMSDEERVKWWESLPEVEF